MAENESFPVGDELPADCLLEIFSYLSFDDMMRVAGVCTMWRRVSQYWFKQVQTLEVSTDSSGCQEWTLQKKYSKRRIYIGSNHKKLFSILHLCGHHINYYQVKHCSRSDIGITKRRKLVFQLIPFLCKNIVEFNILEYESYPSWAFNVMALQWNKLEKLYIKYLLHQTGQDLFALLHNSKQLKAISFVFGYFSLRPVNENFFTYLPTTIEEIKIIFNKTHSKQLRHFISASKNFTSLRSLKFYNLRYLSDAVVLAIADIKSLNQLILHRVKCYESRETIDPIANLENLKSLDLSYNTDLHEDSFINIVESCPQLEQLDICQESMLTDTGMAAIAKLKGLKILKINAKYVSSESIIDLCGSLEVFMCYDWDGNDSDAKKFLEKATNLRLVEFVFCKNLTSNMMENAKKIANERKKNILCMTGLFSFTDFGEKSTPYFKYFEDPPLIPQELFPNYINNYLKEYSTAGDFEFN